MEKTKEIKREQQERYIEGLKRYSQRGIPIYIDGKECRAEDCERLFEVSEDGAFYMGDYVGCLLYTSRRGRGAWICDTDQGLKLLREYKGTVRRLEFEEQVLAYIKDQGFLYVDQYVRNREGELVSVADDGTRFILKDWFDKRECSIKDPAETVAAVRQIAVLHRKMCIRDRTGQARVRRDGLRQNPGRRKCFK